MLVKQVKNEQHFDGRTLTMLTRKNNFLTTVGSIHSDLNKFLEKKDYNVIFFNSPGNDMYEVSIADNTLSGGKAVTKYIYNYETITPKVLLDTIFNMTKEYEISNKYNTLFNKIKRFFSKDNDAFSNSLKDLFDATKHKR